MRILVFGDSIAQGFFDADGGWVNYLRKYFDEKLVAEKDISYPTVFNMSISGDFTRSILARVENEVKARIWPGEEFAFIIAVGANDTLYRGDETESTPEDYAKQLAEIKKILSKYSDKIMCVSLFPIVDKLLQPAPFSETGKCYSTERMKLFNDALKQFCEDNDVGFVDVWKPFSESNDLESLLFDGIHPNAKGHKLMYETIRPKLEEVIA